MPEPLGYEDLKARIENAPVTWLPALVIVVVQAATRNKVFRPGGLATVVARAEAKALDERA